MPSLWPAAAVDLFSLRPAGPLRHGNRRRANQITTGEGVAQLRQTTTPEGQTFYADGDVEIRYKEMLLRADHVEFNG